METDPEYAQQYNEQQNQILAISFNIDRIMKGYVGFPLV